ncbi:c-type cytochrome [Umboniibacter marinipuniceus]|uniref:Cytochrome c556 n=1 Tax=Umboniibacter marinipuniceus TaxID=569599 RepID=A0A3M0A602_9GAMM|nr:cytochrome c [Umboniibacter marinipuniceus]RMA80026.1 cytochrome c556 [Umboniibacter marinipuniceus]
MNKSVLALALLVATPVLANEEVERTIDYRQSVYTVVGKQMGTLAGMARGRIDYNQPAAQLAADTIAQLALVAPHTFSDESVGVDGTDALVAYQTDRADFDTVMEEFQATSATLALALDDADEFPRREFGAMAQTCKGCHDQFKAD